MDYVQRHYVELQSAGLTSWSFDEFFAFCRPFTARRHMSIPEPLRGSASEKAEQLADALSVALEKKYGKPLSRETRESIVVVARNAIVKRNRSRLRAI